MRFRSQFSFEMGSSLAHFAAFSLNFSKVVCDLCFSAIFIYWPPPTDTAIGTFTFKDILMMLVLLSILGIICLICSFKCRIPRSRVEIEEDYQAEKERKLKKKNLKQKIRASGTINSLISQTRSSHNAGVLGLADLATAMAGRRSATGLVPGMGLGQSSTGETHKEKELKPVSFTVPEPPDQIKTSCLKDEITIAQVRCCIFVIIRPKDLRFNIHNEPKALRTDNRKYTTSSPSKPHQDLSKN